MWVAVALALTLPFLVIIGRDWVIRRLAFRNVRRRPIESSLVVLGALFGAAIITASAVVADSLDWSIRSSVATDLGEIDELVTTRDPDVLREIEARLAPLVDDSRVDGVLPFATLPVSVQFDGPNGTKTAMRPRLVEVDFSAAAEFGSDPAASGLSGPTPAPGEAVINRRLADSLGAGPGDRISVFSDGAEHQLTVREIAPQRGVAGLRVSDMDSGRNVFVAPGTIDVPNGATTGTTASAVQRSVAVSNAGGVEDGAALTDAVVAEMQERLADLPTIVRPVKDQRLAQADATSAQLGDLFLAMGVFGALSGALLVVNLFVMLAEERKTQLGVFRALGMTQGALVRAFSVEGWVYGLAASSIGALLGVALGRGIVALVSRVIESVGPEIGLNLGFHVEWASVRTGFLVGLALSTATVMLAGVRFARANIISAVRGLPAPRRPTRPRWLPVVGAVVAMVGVAWTVAAFAGDDGVGIVAAPLLVLVGLGGLAALAAPVRAVATGVAAAAMIWSSVSIRVVLARVEEPSVGAFVVQGVALIGAAVVLLSLHQDRMARPARRLRSARTLVLALGVSHPISRQFRSALTVGMYALVVFTLTFITVLAGIFDRQLDGATTEVSGGASIIVRSVAGAPIPLDDIDSRSDVEAAAGLVTQPVLINDPARPNRPVTWYASTFDDSLLQLGAPRLRERGSFATDEAVYRAVLDNPELAIIDPLLAATLRESLGKVGIGSSLTVIDPSSGATRRVTVAGVGPTDLMLDGMLVGSPVAPPGVTLPVTRALVANTPGSDQAELAAALSRDYATRGAEAEPVDAIVARAGAAQSQFFDLARGYLGLGMLVGIAGLGVVLVRSVRERRREIGVMRSIGIQPEAIGRSFLVEATLLAVQGAAIGAVLGVFTAYNIVTSTDLVGLDLTFGVPVGEVMALTALVLLASLMVTALPARRAASIPPAVALRIAD